MLPPDLLTLWDTKGAMCVKRKLAHQFGLLGIEMYAHLRNFIGHSFALNETDQSGIVSSCQAT